MIIDAHTHLGRKEATINARVGDLLKSMDTGLVDMAAVFAGRLNSITTKQVVEEIRPHKDRLFAIGSVSKPEPGHGMWANIEELEDLMGDGIIRGLKFYPGYEPFYPADEWLRPYLELAVQHDLPCIFHAGDTFSKAGGASGAKLKYALPIHVDELAVDMPKLKIVIAHMGYPWQRESAEVMYKNKNVYADISGFVYGDFDDHTVKSFKKVVTEFQEIAGWENYSQRLLFGTDWPISNHQSYVRSAKEVFDSIDLWGHDGSYGIFSHNARKLFKL